MEQKLFCIYVFPVVGITFVLKWVGLIIHHELIILLFTPPPPPSLLPNPQ